MQLEDAAIVFCAAIVGAFAGAFIAMIAGGGLGTLYAAYSDDTHNAYSFPVGCDCCTLLAGVATCNNRTPNGCDCCTPRQTTILQDIRSTRLALWRNIG